MLFKLLSFICLASNFNPNTAFIDRRRLSITSTLRDKLNFIAKYELYLTTFIFGYDKKYIEIQLILLISKKQTASGGILRNDNLLITYNVSYMHTYTRSKVIIIELYLMAHF